MFLIFISLLFIIILLEVNFNVRDVLYYTKTFYSKKNNISSKNIIVPQEIVLELISSAIQSGCSIISALQVVGENISGKIGNELEAVSRKLYLGESWDESWTTNSKNDGRNSKRSEVNLAVIKECLESAWSKGLSPISSIENFLNETYSNKQTEITKKIEKLSIKISAPLGLCFLPSFILIGVIPIIIAMISQFNFE
jgi:tight adherence protein B